jgi:hypothetical protein
MVFPGTPSLNVSLKSESVCLVTTLYTMYQECRYYPNYEQAFEVVCDPPVWEITNVSVECSISPGGGGTYVPPVVSPCNCDICPMCGGCLEMELKSAVFPGSNGTPTVTCPECSCPENPQKSICNAYRGIINMSSINTNKPNFTPQQEQFIISLANIAALFELGNSIGNLKTDLTNYSTSSNLYTKLNKLGNYALYTSGWNQAFNSYTLQYDALVSGELGNSGFQLKFYPQKDGEYNAIGLVKFGWTEHSIEAALEFLEFIDVKYMGFPDDYLYDMHLFNALNFMEYYCYD